MKSLYLRIYATLVVVLLLFALVAGWIVSRNFEHRRAEMDAEMSARVVAWGDLVVANLPAATASVDEQQAALSSWADRLGLSLALDDAAGQRIATTAGFSLEEEERGVTGAQIVGSVEVLIADGRVLRLLRHGPPMRWRERERYPASAGMAASGAIPGAVTGPMPGTGLDRSGAPPFGEGRSLQERGQPSQFGDARPGGEGGLGRASPPRSDAGRPVVGNDGGRSYDARPFGFDRPGFGPGGDRDRDRDRGQGGPRFGPPPPPSLWWFASTGTLITGLAVLFVAVAAGAYPLVRRLTRRLESLKRGVEAFGAGALHQRVKVDGSDEVAALAVSFNQAASKVEALVRSHQSLLANASHELRSPLARMKMAVSMMDVAAPEHRERLKVEIDTNIAELDSLVEEVLLASRLDASDNIERTDDVDLLALAAEEADRVGAAADGDSVKFAGNERLLRRALRNLLENARRYGGSDVIAEVRARAGSVVMRVCDRGPGVPEGLQERIFEPFYRLPGHAEQAGGVGLGLSLVRQIAERHNGTVKWEPRDGGGSCFVITLPTQVLAEVRL